MRLSKLIVAPLAAAALLVTAGCTPGGGGGGEGEGDGMLRIGTAHGVDSLNPFVGTQQDAYSVWMQMYPTLLQYDTAEEGMPWVGSLAEEWDLSDDGLDLTFTIREGAQWADGEALDAHAVAWSFGVYHEYSDSAAAGWSVGDNITSIEAPDATTLNVTFAEPSALSLNSFATTPIIPRQVWEEHASDADSLRAFSGEPTVAGGPFSLTEYRQGELALFERNPNWYGEQPSIAGFGLQTFRVADAMVTALISGNLDAIYGVPPTSIDALEDAGITIETTDALILRMLIINTNPAKKDNHELLDPNVRKALEHAVDREEIVETAWVGLAEPADSLMPKVSSTAGMEWYNDELDTISYDLDEAIRLLDEAGLERGSDGIRLAPDGSRMEYEVVFADDESGPGDRAFQIMKADFEEIGVVINQRKLDPSAAWVAITDEDNSYSTYDIAMWRWQPSAEPNFILSAMTCDQWGSWNDSGYCNPRVDELVEQQRVTIDPVERKAIIDEIQQIIYDDRPYISLTYDVQIDAWNSDWSGIVTAAQGFFNNWSTNSLVQATRK